jgi:hypothetical protein
MTLRIALVGGPMYDHLYTVITYPPHPRFPEVEDVGWHAINDALRGRSSARAAIAEIQHRAESILGTA